LNLKMIGLAAFATLALSAGTAAAQMQPIPNPPEKPKAASHKAKHHAKKKSTKAADASATNTTEPAKK
jgi:hypothetical protein